MSHTFLVADLIIYGDSPVHWGPEGENLLLLEFSLVLLLPSWLDCKLCEDRNPADFFPPHHATQYTGWHVAVVN